MESLIEVYNRLALKIKTVSDEIAKTESAICELSSDTSENRTLRIAKLEEQIEKIDDYLLKIKGFQELAKKNLDSQNVLTIEAPPGYRVNLNRLRNWAMMIDPMSSNDPYAQRVYIVAKCDELFLTRKREEFTDRIRQLKQDEDDETKQELRRLKESLNASRQQLQEFSRRDEVYAFARSVVEANEKYWIREAPGELANPEERVPYLAPGAYASAFPVDKESGMILKSIMGDTFDAENKAVLLPVEIRNDAEFIMTVDCTPSRRVRLDRGIRNFLLNSLQSCPAGSREYYILDASRYNTASMGGLRRLEKTYLFHAIPRNPSQLSDTLEEIVSSFADIDDIIDQYDSISEYNASVPAGKRIPYKTLVLYGWPGAFKGGSEDLMQRILTNYERYGVSVILIHIGSTDKKTDVFENTMPEYALQNAIRIRMGAKDTTIFSGEEEPQRFTWYSFTGELSEEFEQSVEKCKPESQKIGNDLSKQEGCSLIELPELTRQYKKIELPVGIDGKGDLHTVSFEDENFAAYLVGASRSGKSTLLHTLIASLIRNYHPDNLELWLADFKQVEFKQYIKCCPPHVKYILLDESPELVYDLIDKLTEKMMERQRLFAQLGVEKITQVDVTQQSEPLPVIFVLLDEFSIMSQSIAMSDSYKIRLQNLLAKGAALGIKFLFASQTFTTGVSGLTQTARAQVQQRIAMKGAKSEINETLELSSSIRTEQVTNWMEALPPHYALVKHRTDADTLPVVERYHVLWIPDYKVRDDMIDKINQKLRPISYYNPGDISCYKEKERVFVDGNSYESFDSRLGDLKNWLRLSPDRDDYSGDELFLNVGTPRKMEPMLPIVMTPESRENILFFADSSEMVCTGAVLLSAMRSFETQGGNVRVWAYDRNRLYRKNEGVWKRFLVSTGMKSICTEISSVTNCIKENKTGKDLIVLMGIERICNEFELGDNGEVAGLTSAKQEGFNIDQLKKSGAIVESKSDGTDLLAKWRAMGIITQPFEEKDYSVEDSRSDVEALNTQIAVREESSKEKASAAEKEKANNTAVNKGEQKKSRTDAYNAMEDLKYIIRQGSRSGYHVLIVTNSYADFKQTRIQSELFRHRISFSLSLDDSHNVFNNRTAVGLPEHVCRYSDTLKNYSFRPYLHREFSWDGWFVNDKGEAEEIDLKKKGRSDG